MSLFTFRSHSSRSKPCSCSFYTLAFYIFVLFYWVTEHIIFSWVLLEIIVHSADNSSKYWVIWHIEALLLNSLFVICVIVSGRDCIGCAKTGSGKTAAFALPILQKLCEDPYGIFALVLSPTRFVVLCCVNMIQCQRKTSIPWLVNLSWQLSSLRLTYLLVCDESLSVGLCSFDLCHPC